jgi:hypothetical protein
MSNPAGMRLATSPPDHRATLRDSIRKRDAMHERVHHAQAAERRGRGLLNAAEAELASFGDVDAAVLNHRADKIKRAATGGPPPDMSLPDVLVKCRTARNEACEHIAATKVAYESLVSDLGNAQNASRQAEQHVSDAATAVLVEEGVAVAATLRAAFENVWQSYDVLNALAGCWLAYAQGSQPIRLPSDTLRTLQFITALDHRQHPGGANVAFNRATQQWRNWHKMLCMDSDAVKPEVGDNSSLSAGTKRVA